MKVQGSNNNLITIIMIPLLFLLLSINMGEGKLMNIFSITIGFGFLLMLFGFSLIVRYVEFTADDFIVKYLFRTKKLSNNSFKMVQISKTGFIFVDELGKPMMQLSKTIMGEKCYQELKETITNIYCTKTI